jgi:hypothetical protein
VKEGKGAIKWTRLSCRSFAANAVRLQLHALAYNLGNVMRTLAMQPAREVDQDRLQCRQPRALRHVSDGRGRRSQKMFVEILTLIARLEPARDGMTGIRSDATDNDGRGTP